FSHYEKTQSLQQTRVSGNVRRSWPGAADAFEYSPRFRRNGDFSRGEDAAENFGARPGDSRFAGGNERLLPPEAWVRIDRIGERLSAAPRGIDRIDVSIERNRSGRAILPFCL